MIPVNRFHPRYAGLTAIQQGERADDSAHQRPEFDVFTKRFPAGYWE